MGNVKAMYGGVVVKVVTDWESAGLKDQYLGKQVVVRSCTNPNDGAGFEHTYAHLNRIDIEMGNPIRKGQVIVESGNTGKGDISNHLHVHLRPFGPDGTTTSEDIPGKESNADKPEVTKVARRIYGCLNFTSFLPPDGPGVPAIDGIALRPTGKLQRPRGNNARMAGVVINTKVGNDRRGIVEAVGNDGHNVVLLFVLLVDHRPLQPLGGIPMPARTHSESMIVGWTRIAV